jgi:hypothetical protein
MSTNQAPIIIFAETLHHSVAQGAVRGLAKREATV